MNVFEQGLFFFKNGDHGKVVELFTNKDVYDPYDLRMDYSIALSTLLKPDHKSGLMVLDALVDKCKGLYLREDISPDILNFMMFVSMQTALIADFFLDSDMYFFSEIAFKALNEACGYANALGNASFEQEVVKMQKRCISAEKPLLINDTPSTLQIETTNNCNLKCRMCPRSKMTRSIVNMDIPLYEKIFDGWKGKYRSLDFTHLAFGEKISIKKPGSVKLFFLGEPLLHPEFDEFVKIAEKYKVIVNLQTNGTLLNRKENVKKLLDTNLFALGVSLDGLLFDDYENIRLKSDGKKVQEGMELLINERNKSGSKMKIDVSTIVTDLSHKQAVYQSSFGNILKKVDSVNYIVLDKSFSPSYHDENGKIISYENEVKEYEKGKSLCEEPFFKLNILSDGSITPCCHDINGEMSFGNILDENLDSVWNGDALKLLRTELFIHEIKTYPMCRICRFGS